MAQPVQLWRDRRGFLHESAEAADHADLNFEREDRREVVRSLLVKQIQATYGPARSNTSGGSSSALADWMIDHWQSLRAIGFAYRVHELGASGETEIQLPVPAPQTGAMS
ncbi:hypothetical protein MFUR16E_04485 [Methylobacterium fujisawaense]|uniref:hypothetical protein n=1 Tax=Methylobacterium fujisawaense TaxID=107400 RepID=UPI002F32FB47